MRVRQCREMNDASVGVGKATTTMSPRAFPNLLKRERIRRQTYQTRAEALQNVFDYIEMFYNPRRKQVRDGMMSPVKFERRQKMRTGGYSEVLPRT